jgi:hypothetical protein
VRTDRQFPRIHLSASRALEFAPELPQFCNNPKKKSDIKSERSALCEWTSSPVNFQMALADAQSLAVGRDHQFIEPLHLMLALLDQDGGSVRHLLAQADVNVNRLRSTLGEGVWKRQPQVSRHRAVMSASPMP